MAGGAGARAGGEGNNDENNDNAGAIVRGGEAGEAGEANGASGTDETELESLKARVQYLEGQLRDGNHAGGKTVVVNLDSDDSEKEEETMPRGQARRASKRSRADPQQVSPSELVGKAITYKLPKPTGGGGGYEWWPGVVEAWDEPGHRAMHGIRFDDGSHGIYSDLTKNPYKYQLQMRGGEESAGQGEGKEGKGKPGGGEGGAAGPSSLAVRVADAEKVKVVLKKVKVERDQARGEEEMASMMVVPLEVRNSRG